MRESVLVAVVGALIAVCAAPSAGEDKKPEETKTIPRNTIHGSGSDQENPKVKEWTEDDRDRYKEIVGSVKKSGPSNVFLVYAEDFRWAVAATYQAYNYYSAGSATGETVLLAAVGVRGNPHLGRLDQAAVLPLEAAPHHPRQDARILGRHPGEERLVGLQLRRPLLALGRGRP